MLIFHQHDLQRISHFEFQEQQMIQNDSTDGFADMDKHIVGYRCREQCIHTAGYTEAVFSVYRSVQNAWKLQPVSVMSPLSPEGKWCQVWERQRRQTTQQVHVE